MESKDMIYIISEYASQGEIFGKFKLFWYKKIECFKSDYCNKYNIYLFISNIKNN